MFFSKIYYIILISSLATISEIIYFNAQKCVANNFTKSIFVEIFKRVIKK
jgi:hypothetical protein